MAEAAIWNREGWVDNMTDLCDMSRQEDKVAIQYRRAPSHYATETAVKHHRHNSFGSTTCKPLDYSGI